MRNYDLASRPIEDELAKINNFALKPVTADEVFIFEFELQNSLIDAYYPPPNAKFPAVLCGPADILLGAAIGAPQ